MNITVVIPLYNKSDTIERAVQSVLAQSFEPKQILIVDDGSTDSSVEKAGNFIDSRIRLIIQSNQGVAAARNTGIANAGSEWIAFLDADDEWKPHFLKKISDLHSQCPDARVFATGYELTHDNRTFKKVRLDKIPFESYAGLLSNYFQVAAASAPPICSSAVVIHKTAIEEIGGFPVGIIAGEDLLTWARLAAKFPIAYNTTALSVFHLGGANAYLDIPTRLPDKNDFVGKELKRMYQKEPVTGLREYIGLWHKMRASIYLRIGHNRAALKEILISLGYNFTWKLVIYTFMLFIPSKIRLQLFKKLAN